MTAPDDARMSAWRDEVAVKAETVIGLGVVIIKPATPKEE